MEDARTYNVFGGFANIIFGGFPNIRLGGLPNIIFGGFPNILFGGFPDIIFGGFPNTIFGGSPNIIFGGFLNMRHFFLCVQKQNDRTETNDLGSMVIQALCCWIEPFRAPDRQSPESELNSPIPLISFFSVRTEKNDRTEIKRSPGWRN